MAATLERQLALHHHPAALPLRLPDRRFQNGAQTCFSGVENGIRKPHNGRTPRDPAQRGHVHLGHVARCGCTKFESLLDESTIGNDADRSPHEARHQDDQRRHDYQQIAKHAGNLGMQWFASPWDVPSVEFLEDLDVVTHKIASSSVTDRELLRAVAATGKPVLLSTGMSTLEEVDAAVEILGTGKLVILHATSTYPMPPEEANLRTIPLLQRRYGVPVGYSGHERGLQISLAAVTLGAAAVARHITLARTMWGSDHAASLEPGGLEHLVRDIRVIEEALGDGVKRVFPGELEPRQRLRRTTA